MKATRITCYRCKKRRVAWWSKAKGDSIVHYFYGTFVSGHLKYRANYQLCFQCTNELRMNILSIVDKFNQEGGLE